MNAIHTTIKGNVTHDPQYRKFEDGGCLCTFSVAVNDHYFDQNAESWKERKTEYVKVQIRRSSLASNIMSSVRRGTPVVVRGRLTTATWEDRGGAVRHDLVLHTDTVGVDLTYGTVEYSKAATQLVDPNTGEVRSVEELHETRSPREEEMQAMEAGEVVHDRHHRDEVEKDKWDVPAIAAA